MGSRYEKKDERAQFKRTSHRVTCNRTATIYMSDHFFEAHCVDVDDRAMAFEMPALDIEAGQPIMVVVRNFHEREDLKVSLKISRIEYFLSHITREQNMLLVCEYDNLKDSTRNLIHRFLTDDKVEVAS